MTRIRSSILDLAFRIALTQLQHTYVATERRTLVWEPSQAGGSIDDLAESGALAIVQ